MKITMVNSGLKRLNMRHWSDVGVMSTPVYDVSPTLAQHWMDVPCLLGCLWFVSTHYVPTHTYTSIITIQYNIQKVVIVTIIWSIEWMNEYFFTPLSAQSWQYRDRKKPEAGIMPYYYFEWLQGFFIVHRQHVHYMPLNSFEHCVCTTTMTNIRPDRDSNLVPTVYKPRSTPMSYRGRHNHLKYNLQ